MYFQNSLKLLHHPKACLVFVWIWYYYLVTHGRSHFLLRNPSNKRRKREESKEILAFDHFEKIKEAEYQTEIYSLKEKINEFKMIQLEDSKYREIVENLIEKGVISRDGEEVIKF